MAAKRAPSGKRTTAGGSAGDGGAGGPEDAYDATPFLPGGHGRGDAGLRALCEAAAGCRGCPLHREATQTVFGSGDADARVFLVGEQPGDQEDRRGEPFVGPAGRTLDRALGEAGIDPAQTYVTNAVKHFKWAHEEGRGKRRIHKPPTLREMTACGPWLAAELALTRPEVLVVLGATAGKALFGSSFRVTKERGTCTERDVHGRTERVVPTIHPSAVLRAGDERSRDEAYAGLVADLRVAARMLD
ncbi:UdgX family uracil-DNA binding protein [Streptomyces albus subsp. chlorinus]|uniref:UdgX family uracil-DNA binding protein n=1 Tax=Streptomyces albus TaxID=1888 RepID=UPI00156E84CF|nr:UdgX family uracil-DNA binding protein [Streptomyces albus]NSC23238.1 UdgX family uracil-DNA binding protein [Streptomyces albus subsp. chlorinus]